MMTIMKTMKSKKTACFREEPVGLGTVGRVYL